MIALHDARADDADHAGVPAFVGEDDRTPAGIAGHAALFGEFAGLVKDLALGGLALLVLLVELLGDLHRAGLAGHGEHLDGFGGVAHPAAGVEARAEDEPDLLGVDGLVEQVGGREQGAEASEIGCADVLEAEGGDDAVLVDERDDVGDGAEGGEGKQVEEDGADLGADAISPGSQRRDAPGEFEGDARAAELAEGVGGLAVDADARVDDGVGVGERAVSGFTLAGDVVVVGDDQVEAELVGGLGLIEGRDATVHADDEAGAFVVEATEGGAVEAVALFEAVGDVGAEVGFGLDRADGVVEDAGGGDAVDVVVAVDSDLLAGSDGFKDAGRGLVEAGHERRVVQRGQRRGGEGEGGFDLGEAARFQEAGDERIGLQGSGEARLE